MKERREIMRELAERAHDRQDGLWASSQKSALESANVAIRAMLLINGGAVVALLAFLGTLESSNAETVSLKQFETALRAFAYGVGLSAGTALLAYPVNLFDAEFQGSSTFHYETPFVRRKPRSRFIMIGARTLHLGAMITAVLSLVAFFWGVNSIADVVRGLGW